MLGLGLEFVDAPSGGGSTTFLGLTDVSATSIVDGQCVAGSSGSLAFQPCGTGGGGITQVESDATLTGTGVSGDALSVANPPATFAYATGASGFIPDANVPASIARDTEIPTIVQGTGIAIAVTSPNAHTISLVDPTDDTGVTTITATGSNSTPGTVHFAGNVTVAASGNTTTVTVLDTGGTGEPAAPTQLAHVLNLGNLDVMNAAGAIRTISLSPDLSTILDDDWIEIWFRHGTNADEVIPEPLQIRAAILKDLASTTGSNENLNNPNEWIGVEIGRMAGNNLNYFGQATLYIGRDQTNLRLAMSLNNQGTSPSIVTITHVPRGGPAGVAGPAGSAGAAGAAGAAGTPGTDGTDGATGAQGATGGQGATGAAGAAGAAGTDGNSVEITDGTNTVSNIATLTVTGATVGGSGDAATLTVTGGGGGVSNFLALTDVTPTSYTDEERRLVSVNTSGNGLIFTDFGDTVNEIMNTNSIETNDRWFIYDESEGLPRHVHHSVMQTLMADGQGIVTLTGANTFSETPATLNLIGSGVSLAESGGVVTATITGGGGGGGTALTKAQADSGTDTTEGLVSGLLLYDAITTHAHEFGIPEVGSIPATETAPVLFLTHDYDTGTRSDRTITPAALGTTYYGWSTGQNLTAGGSVANNDSMGCLTAISGSPVSGATWSPDRIWSTNRACMESFTHIIINNASYPPSTLTFSDLGLYWRQIGSAPTLTGGDDFTFNLRIAPFLPATYYFADGTDDTYAAGLWEWVDDDSAYERLSSGTGAGDLTGIITNNTSGLSGGCLIGDCTLSADLDSLTEVTSANVNPLADFLAFVDASETNDPTRKIRTDRFLESINGTGLSVSMSGLLFVSGNAFAESEAFEPSEDRVVFFANDNSNSARREEWSDIAVLTAGVGIGTTDGAYRFDPDELTSASVNTADDTFVFIDESSSGDPPRKVGINSFLQAIDGTGLTAASGMLSVDTVPLTRGGTGGITAAEARTNIQIAPNPSGSPTATLEKILFGTTVYRHGHPHKGNYDASVIYQQGDIIETGTGVDSIFWIAREVISAGQGAPSNDDLGLWWRAAGHGYYRGTLVDTQTYDIYRGDYYISDNELWVAFQTLADRTGTELAGNIDGMDRLLNEIVIRSDGQAPLDSSDNSLTVDHLNEIDFRGAGVEVLAINDTYGQSVAVTIAGGSGGISQSDADARYVELAGDTMTDTLTVTPADNSVALLLDARALTTQTPFVFFMNASGNQQAFWLKRGTDGQAFFTLDGNIGGGNANPGIALGPGGSTTRDVTLYRGGSNALETEDAFTAKTLGLASGTIDGQSAAQRLATTQANLGIGFVIADLTAESTIDPDADLLGFADVSASDPEERKATIEEILTGSVSSSDFSFSSTGLMELAATDAFDIHDDVTQDATIADADLIIFSDEGSSPYPMRNTTAANLADYMQTEVRIPTGSIVNDAVTQAKIADAAVGVDQLKIGEGSNASPPGGTFFINGLSFAPWLRSTLNNVDCALYTLPSNTSDYGMRIGATVRVSGAAQNCTTSERQALTVHWRYITSSDNPSVWVILDSNGVVTTVWEAEDPPENTPFGALEDDQGDPLPGYTVVNVGLPTFSVIEQVYAAAPLDGSTRDLTAAQRTAAVTASSDYFLERGWITSPITSIVTPATMAPDRYRRSVLQWYMRFAAQAKGEAVTSFYLANLVVANGSWALPTP